jgi:hypothetical protein
MNDKMMALIAPDRLWSRSEILARPCPVPPKPGVYAWFFKEIPSPVPVDGCVTWQGLTMLYVGISPSRLAISTGSTAKQNLRTRIRHHFRGNAYGSTLRLSLGCMLSESLGIRLQQVGKKRKHFADGERVLSQWMEKNAFVAWVVQEKPWELEEHLIDQLNLPLNLRGNENHHFYPLLSQIRKECKRAARVVSG